MRLLHTLCVKYPTVVLGLRAFNAGLCSAGHPCAVVITIKPRPSGLWENQIQLL